MSAFFDRKGDSRFSAPTRSTGFDLGRSKVSWLLLVLPSDIRQLIADAPAEEAGGTDCGKERDRFDFCVSKNVNKERIMMALTRGYDESTLNRAALHYCTG